jgi:NAD(P)-dependent dehydrogenase (short-subunit alcohol dehydrogenase family)
MGTASSSLNKSSTAMNVISHYAQAQGVNATDLLAGKRAIVTGGNSGIGTETVKALAFAGAKVVIGSRSVAAGEEAIKTEICGPGPFLRTGDYSLPATSANRISVAQLDLENLESISKFAENVLSSGECIDYLICNAGIMALETREETSNKWEKQLATNHFGHHYLISLLREKMIAQQTPCRIVLLSSLAHKRGNVEVNDLHFTKGREYSPWTAYGQSKLANLLEAKELADQLVSTKVCAVSVHPGIIRTNLARHMELLKNPIVTFLFENLVVDKSIPQGASTTLYACLEPSLDQPELRGSYLADCSPAIPNDAGKDADKKVRRALWELTEREIQAALKR